MSFKSFYRGLGLAVFLAAILAAPNGSAAAKIPTFKQPILITTAGQSIDMHTVKALCNKAELKSEVLPMAKPSDLNGIETLIVVPAHSNKGLGSAGIDVDGEMKRVKTLLQAAKRMNMPVVLIHVGGQVRRSGDSDPFIIEVLNYPPKLVVVYKDGNNDGFFTKRCEAGKIPLVLIDKVFDLTDVLKQMFNV